MSQGTPEHQVVALLQRGDLRGAHQLLLALLAQRPDDAALRTRAQQVEALIHQRLQSGLPVGPTAAPAPVAAAPQPGYGAPPAQSYDPQTLAALQAQVLAEPVRYAHAYLQAGRLGESLQLLRIALAREPGNTQVRDLALYVARQIQQQQTQAAHAAAPPSAPAYGAPAPAYGTPAAAYGTPAGYAQGSPPAPAPPAAPTAPPRAAPPPPPAATLESVASPVAPSAPPVPPMRQSAAPPPAAARYPQDAKVHRTGEMPAFMIDESPMLAAAAALPPRTQLPPSTPPAPPAAPAARYPIDARAAESVEMPLDDLSLPSEPRASAPQSVPVRSSAVPSAPPSMPFAPAGLPSSSVPPDESRPEPNEVVRVAREMVKAAARMELERARASAPAASLEVAIDMDEPVEAVPVDFDEAPEPEEEAPPSLGQWPGPDWVDRSIPSAPSPLGRSLHSDPLERPVRSAAPPAPLRSQPPAAHRWDADFSSPEQDAFQTDDEPMPEWTAPAPRPSPAPVAEDPLVREARARAERMQEAFARFSNRASAPAPAAPEPSEPAVDYSAGLDAELALASDAAATEIAVPSDLYGMEDEPLGSPEDEAIPADEPYDFEPVPLEAEALQSMPPEPTPPPRPPAWSREDSAGFSGNPPAFEQNVLADPRPSFVSAPSAPSSGEVAMLEALLGQIRERRRNPSRYWESV